MRNVSLPLFSFVLVLFFGIVIQTFSPKVFAGDLAQGLVRFDRIKAATATGSMICAKTPASDNGTEAKVQVTFPSDFTLNSTTSNYTTSTSNILSGATAWPGIGTATAVSGNTVTFPSSNLSVNTLYCFHFAAISTVTTGAAGQKLGTITTQTSGSSTIDSITYALTIQANDQISVSATVPANASDFDATLTKLTSGSTFNQNQTIEYELTYGSNLSYATSITVEAEWSRGTISGQGTPTVDILDYVVGSASTGYNSTPAVVDTTNRTIQWTISSIPANTTGQTVTFQLKTNDSYTGASLVSFDVTGRVLGPGTQTPDSTISSSYQYSVTATPTPTATTAPTPTNTPGPTNTPAPGATATPTPTPTPAQSTIKTTINLVEIKTISSSTATILTETSTPTTIILQYGLTPTTLTQTINDLTARTRHEILLENLEPKTQYYFRIVATTITGQKINSDIFTFTTARVSEVPTFDLTSLTILASDMIIFDPRYLSEQDKKGPFVAVVGEGMEYKFKIALKDGIQAQYVRAILRNKQVLGLNNTEITESNTYNTDMLEIEPGVYVGSLKAPRAPGFYELYSRIVDYNGNIAENKLFEVKISPNLTVLSQATNKPIEAAEITLFRYNQRTQLYDRLTPQIVPVNNPSYTATNGEIILPLPQGRYRAEIVAIGYRNKTVDFILSRHPGDDYPIVFLASDTFNIFTPIRYYTSIMRDASHTTTAFFANLTESYRFFELMALCIVAATVLVTFLCFHARLHLHPLRFPLFLRYLFKHSHPTNETRDIRGKLTNTDDGTAISQAMLYVYRAEDDAIIAHATTNDQGVFSLRQVPLGTHKLLIIRNGFVPLTLYRDISRLAADGELLLSISKDERHSFMRDISWFGHEAGIITFNTFLFISVVNELWLGAAFGFAIAAPFIALSTFNLLLWVLHQRHAVSQV